MTRPAFPPGRYGRRREPHRAGRWVVPLLATAVVAATLMLAVFAYQRQTSQVQTTVRKFVVGTRDVRVTFEVHKPRQVAATCVVRARDIDGREVGRALVKVPAGRRNVTLTYVLRTSGPPVTGEVSRCTAEKA